ncbi:MAG: class I SAM-dependent methyltransferase [Candidatus Thermoplasmatota archaeon]
MRSPSKADVRASYERIAESFSATRKEPWPEVLRFIRTLPDRARVLDVGCGNGRHARALVDRGLSAVALDFSRSLLLLGRERGAEELAGRLHWVEGEATALPLRTGSVDAALCVAVLHHLPTRGDRVAALREIRRVLVPGGRVFVSVWALDQPRFQKMTESQRGRPPESRGDVEVPWTLPDGTVMPRYYHLFQKGELEALIIESGLHGETFFRSGGNWFGQATNHG